VKKRFALIGAAGYIAPKHYKSIKETGHELVAAFDPSDNVGVLDTYFHQVDFFNEFERFERHLYMLERIGRKVDYVVVCSPNYLHDSHVRFGLRYGADVVCEKPLVLQPHNAEALIQAEALAQKSVSCILQLRLHPAIMALKQQIDGAGDVDYNIDLTYITPRGNWYYTSWKGDESKSGGIVTNIGIHLFDMLCWLFGDPKESNVHVRTHDRASGILEFSKAKVRWFLSVNGETLPEPERITWQTYRKLTINNVEVDFSSGFTDLHTQSYRQILSGNGFGPKECLAAISLVSSIRQATLTPIEGSHHPFATLPLHPHPFVRSI